MPPSVRLPETAESIATSGQELRSGRISSVELTRTALDRIEAPVLLLQGRRDFAFDIAQATAAYQRLRGPKRLYMGDLGHAPAPDPEAEIPHYLNEGRMWFDRWLKGAPNGIDKQPPVELAPDPWTGKTVSYAGLPPTRNLAFATTGSQTVGTDGKVVRNLGTTRQLVETFGSAVVRVSVKPSNGWGHVVAVLSAKPRRGGEIVVSDGGAAVSHAGRLTIRLLADATALPAGSQLRLTLASSSTAQSGANLLYLDIPQPPSAKLAVGRATVTIPVLLKPISQ